MEQDKHQPSTSGWHDVGGASFMVAPTIRQVRDENTGILFNHSISLGPTERTEMYWHSDETDAVMLARGSGMPIFGHVGGTRFSRAPSRALMASFTPHGVDLGVEFSTSAQLTSLLFPKRLLTALMAEMGVADLSPRLYSTDPKFRRVILALADALVHPGFVGAAMVDGLTRNLAATIAGIEPGIAQQEAERIRLAPFRLRQVIDYIEANLAKPITLAEMANAAGLSVFHFSRVFTHAMGLSPYRYLAERRIMRAKQLLVQDQLSVAEIGQVCGIANPAHFSTAFSKAVGMSPSTFRRESRRTANS